MANNQDLKNAVIEVIKSNGNEEITGLLLQNVLLSIINHFGNGYLFGGVVKSSDSPIYNDLKTFYLAAETGVDYPNFDSNFSEKGFLNIFTSNGLTIEKFKIDLGVNNKADVLITAGKNKYNPLDNQINYWIAPDNGRLINENNPIFIVSGFIEADEYNYVSRPYLYNYFAIAYYSDNKQNAIKPLDVNGNELPFEVGNQKNIAIKRPPNARYIVITVAFGDPDGESREIQVEKGIAFTGYEEYKKPYKQIDPDLMGDYVKKGEKTTGFLNVENSDKIAFYGCSYTESFYTLTFKSWINKLSNMLDCPLGNFAVSGNTLIELNDKIKRNFNPFHSTVGIREYKPTAIVVANIGNEATHIFGNYADMYLNEVKETCNLIKGLGATPVLGTDWVIENHSIDALLYDYSKNNNILYFGIGSDLEQVSKTKFDNFWYGHPGTRTNAPIWIKWLEFLKNYNTQKSVKLFRPRNENETIINLNYDNNNERCILWQEINVGEFSLNPGNSENYFDKLWDRGEYSASARENEYCKLIAKESIIFPKKALIEFTLDRVKIENAVIKIKSTTQGLKFYTKNTIKTAVKYDPGVGSALLNVSKNVFDLFDNEVLNAEYVISEKPGFIFYYKGKFKSDALGGYFLSFKCSSNWDYPTQEIPGTITRVSDSRVSDYLKTSPLSKHSFSAYTTIMGKTGSFEEIKSVYENGYYKIIIDNYLLLDNEKIKLIAGSTSDFDISDVSVEYYGGENKVLKPYLEQYNYKFGFNVLNEQTGFGADSYNNSFEIDPSVVWSKINVVNQYPSFNNDLSCLNLGYDNNGFPGKVKKTITIDKSRFYKKMIVKVTARINPKVFDLSRAEDDNFTHTPQVTKKSFDYGTLCAGVNVNGSFPVTTVYSNKTPGSISRHFVDLSWSEIIFDFLISPYSTEIDLSIWRDENDANKNNPLQICDVEISIN